MIEKIFPIENAIICVSTFTGIDKLALLHFAPSSKLGSNGSSNVLTVMQGVEEAPQLEEFGVIGIIKPRFNWNTVVNLISKGMRAIVYQDHFAHVSP